MVIRCGGTLNTIANMSMNTPTYAYAYKYAAFDGLRRIAAAGKESLDESVNDESAKRLSANL
jgi:NAD(P) transhydrogenase